VTTFHGKYGLPSVHYQRKAIPASTVASTRSNIEVVRRDMAGVCYADLTPFERE